jgi:chorismate mutase/prephenate dehydratase
LVDVHKPESGTAESPLVVAYLGSEGGYSHLAAEQHFAAAGVKVVCRGYPSFRAALLAVESGAAQRALQPIENTTAGSINEAYDLLTQMDLYVIGEEVLRIEHCLVGLPGVPLSDLRRIYSHPQGLAQCSEFLATLEECAAQSFENTATAVKKIAADNDPSQAAIASERAANLYGLCVLKRDIANQAHNFTRFVVVAREPAHYAASIPCKTSLIFTTRHEQGALVRCLNILADHGLNLTKLESRPRPETPWEYIFYADVEGNIESRNVSDALTQMQNHTSFFKVLGSYPARTRSPSTPAPSLS